MAVMINPSAPTNVECAKRIVAFSTTHDKLCRVSVIDVLTTFQKFFKHVVSTPSFLCLLLTHLLIEAIQTLIDKTRAVSLLSPAQVTLSNPDVFFLIKNAPEAIFQTLNQSSTLYVESVREQVLYWRASGDVFIRDYFSSSS